MRQYLGKFFKLMPALFFLLVLNILLSSLTISLMNTEPVYTNFLFEIHYMQSSVGLNRDLLLTG